MVEGAAAQNAPRELFRLAKYKYDQQAYEGALDFINKAISADTSYMSAFLLRADINFALGYYYTSIKDINHAFMLDPQRAKSLAEYYLLRGKCFREVKEDERALADFRASLSISNDNPEAHYLIARIYDLQGAPREAIREIDAAINIKSDVGRFYAERAKMRYNTYKPIAGSKLYESVLADINVAIALQPDVYEFHHFRAQLIKRDKSSDFNYLLDECNRVVDKFPNRPEAYKDRGVLFMNHFEYTNALMDFTMAIALNKNDEQNYRYRALCYYNMNKYDQALSDYSISLRMLNNQLPETDDKKQLEFILAETYFQRGNAHLVKRKNREACQDFLRSYNLGAKKGLNSYRKHCNVY